MRGTNAAITKGVASEIFVIVVRKDGKPVETRAYLSGKGARSAVTLLEKAGFTCDFWGSRIQGFRRLN